MKCMRVKTEEEAVKQKENSHTDLKTDRKWDW